MGRFANGLSHLNGRIDSALDTIEETSTRKIVILLFVITFTCAAPLLIGYEAKDRPFREQASDIGIFRDRANTILAGELLYSDTEMVTMTPPVINYLMAPAILLGDTVLIWELWFTFFVFLTSTILFFILEPLAGRQLGLAGAMTYATNPFGYYTCIAMIQDDAIIAVFIALTILFLVKEKWGWAAASTSLGTMTKMFPALISPLVFLAPNNWKERAKVAGYGFGIALLISLPFLIFAFDGFRLFLEFYLFGKQPPAELAAPFTITGQRGMSLWRFLAVVGYVVPTNVLHISFFTVIIACWVAVWKKKFDSYSGITLCILAIFIFYSKVHYGYHMMALVVLIPWSLHDSKRIWSLLVVATFGRYVHLAWIGRLDFQSDWLFLFCSFLMWAYWVWWAVTIIRQPDFNKHWSGELDTRKAGLACIHVAIAGIIISVIQGVIKAFTWWS